MKKIGISFIFCIFISLFALSGCYTSLKVQKGTSDISLSLYQNYNNVWYPYSWYYPRSYWYYDYTYIPLWDSWYRFGFYWDGGTIGWWNYRYYRPWYWHHDDWWNKFPPLRWNEKFRTRLRDNDGGRGIIRSRDFSKDNFRNRIKREGIRNDRDDRNRRENISPPQKNSGTERTREGISPRKDTPSDRGKSSNTSTKRESTRDRGRR